MQTSPARTPRSSRRYAHTAAIAAALLVLTACASVTTEADIEAAVRTSTTGTGGFSELSAALETGRAEFFFTHASSGTFRIEMSTDPNMNGNVFGNFGSGHASPIVVVDNATEAWDEYKCGATLYWRVMLDGTGDVSAIQTAVVCPPNVFSDLSGAFNRNQALFVFSYAGDEDEFTIHASTRPDMGGNLWTTKASRSPVRVRQPTSEWPGYDCGYILYWRVVDAAGVRSPIQEKHVCGSVGFSDETAAFDADGAVFTFQYRGAADDFRVDVSTLPDMSWDVYVGFGSGKASPIAVASPQARWDKYRCGSTLYWRVRELSNGAVGEIHATTVTCPPAP